MSRSTVLIIACVVVLAMIFQCKNDKDDHDLKKHSRYDMRTGKKVNVDYDPYFDPTVNNKLKSKE